MPDPPQESGGPPTGEAHEFPRIPAHAWTWLQRSRVVLAEVAQRLTGGPPDGRFLEELRGRCATDSFTRDVLVGAVVDVAFNGRVPRQRPPGVSWDRGLTWWAATIAGTTPAAFEARSAPASTQRRLFGADDEAAGKPAGPFVQPRPAPSADRAMIVAGLRDLLASVDGDQVPASAVRQLLATLTGDEQAPGSRPTAPRR